MGNQYTRTIELGRANETARSIPVVVSTETPYDRGNFVEVLSHDPKHVDLSRGDLPLIESHDAGRVNIGVVEQLKIVGGKLRGIARFGSTTRAKELFQDALDGVVRGLSIGYEITQELSCDGRVCRFAFMPYEVSIVAVPADTSAGFFRSKTMNNEHIEITENADNDPQNQRSRRAAAKDPDAERMRSIISIGDQYSHYVNQADTSRAVRDGWTVDRFREFVLSKMESGHTAIGERDISDGSGSDWASQVKQFSFARAALLTIDPVTALRAGGSLEREVSQELSRRVGFQSLNGGILVPDAAMFRRDFNVGTATEAGNLVATSLRADLFADYLRSRTICGALGVRIMSDLTSNVDIPKKSAVSSVAWRTEIQAATESNPTTDKISLTPKRISSYVEVSKQAIIQSSLSLENLIRDDLVNGAMVEIDRVMLSGSGSGAEPTGIVNTTGIGTVTGGTNGAAITWAHLLELESDVADQNADIGAGGYAINPKTRAALKRTQKGTNLDFCWPDVPLSADGFGQLNGYRAGVSTLLPSNLTKGTSTTVCSQLIFGGDWSEAILGRFGAAEVTVDPYTLATTGQVRITLNQFVDCGVRRPEAFSKMVDALTT